MCKWGTNTLLTVTIPARLSHTGVEREGVKGIDSCIAAIVEALNAHGVKTTQSCCGHGKRDGEIALADGRTLIVKVESSGEETRSFCGDGLIEVAGNEWEESLRATCIGCLAASGRWRTRNEAVKAWNTRAPVDTERLVRLEKVLEKILDGLPTFPDLPRGPEDELGIRPESIKRITVGDIRRARAALEKQS